jgi:FemAB-related protein (PEP-CTERM system-associated)
LNVELLDVRFTRAMDRYVAAHPKGTPFHETRWLDLVRSTSGFEGRSLVAWSGREIRGVLPLAMVAAPLTGRRLVSVPYGVYGGILASDSDAVGALDEAARTLGRTSHVHYVETRYLGEPPTSRACVTGKYQTFRQQLPGSADDVLAMIPRKARAEVRKARTRHGMELVEGAELLNGFYELYCINKRSLGSPVFRKSHFRMLMDLYGARALLHGVKKDGELLAAVLSLAAGPTIYPYYSGAAGHAGRLGVNNFMYAALMEDAATRGFKTFDFGRSRVGSGPASFKQHMGFEPTELSYQFYFPFGGKPSSISPSNPKMAIPQKILSSLPMWAARAVGPSLMRLVP